jgi:hypothetical protein
LRGERQGNCPGTTPTWPQARVSHHQAVLAPIAGPDNVTVPTFRVPNGLVGADGPAGLEVQSSVLFAEPHATWAPLLATRPAGSTDCVP